MSVSPTAQPTAARPSQQPSNPSMPRPAAPRPPPGFAQVLARIRCPKHGMATPQVPLKAPAKPAVRGAQPQDAHETVKPDPARVEARELGRDAEERSPGAGREVDLLDPSFRQAAQLAPPQGAGPVTAPASPEAVEVPKARMSLEELLPALVRRIAWSGDRHKGTVRLEIGAGAYEGTTLVVHADGGRVRVEVSGTHADALRPRLDERLRRHGLDVDSVT